MSQYGLYAFDTSTHTSEEAKRSDITTPISMLASLSTVVLLGFAVLVALTFCVPVGAEQQALFEASGGEVLVILATVFQSR